MVFPSRSLDNRCVSAFYCCFRNIPLATAGVLAAGDRTPRSDALLIGYFHTLLDEAPRIGDTTSSIALLFSPSFLSVGDSQPGYPNYTLPVPDLPTSSPPSTPPDSTLVFFPGSNPQQGLFRSACALKQFPPIINITTRNSSFVLRDLGWKVQYLVEGLNPGQSYIAYSIAETAAGVTLSQPATVITKSGMSLSVSTHCYLTNRI